MRGLSLRSKVLASFLLVLLPMLGLIVYKYGHDHGMWSDKILDDQLLTAQAVSALVDASIDDAFSVAWSLSRDPALQTMDPSQAGPRLANLKQSLPQFDDVAVIDLEGNAVGLMAYSLPPGASRPSGADRPYFLSVKSTLQPAVSNVLISRSTGNPTLVAAVPMQDGTGDIRGVMIAALDLGYLAQRLQVVELSEAQAIFLTDPDGTVALHTLLPRQDWGRRSLSAFSPVQSALNGVLARERTVESLVGDMRMISTVRTNKYGWVVGVSIPTVEALRPVQEDLARQLLLFAGALVFAALVAVLSVRHMMFRPLGALTDTLLSFGKGQLGARAHLETGDEFEKLGSGFDWMADEISLRERQRDALIGELTEAKARLQGLASIVESTDDLIIGISANGVITSWNPAAESICGYSAEEAVGKTVPILTPLDRQTEIPKILELIGRGEQVRHFETRWVRKDLTPIDVSVTVSPIRGANGEIMGASTIGRDITARKQTEESFRVLAESSPIGTYIVEKGKFRFVNARFQEYTGYCKDELMGTDALDLVLPQDRRMVRAYAVQMLKGERDTPYEYRVASKVGNIRWILETVASIHYEGQRMVVGNFMDITERRVLEQQLAHLATHDPLTGLSNRRSLEEALNHVVARSRRGVRSALLFLDLDNFKQVNDTLGHAAGDRALVMVARMLQQQVRPADLLVRLGGDEFAILLEGAEASEAEVVSRRICLAIEQFPVNLDQETFHLGVSVGVAIIRGECNPSMLLSHADAAMYSAKAQGGGRVVFHESDAPG